MTKEKIINKKIKGEITVREAITLLNRLLAEEFVNKIDKKYGTQK